MTCYTSGSNVGFLRGANLHGLTGAPVEPPEKRTVDGADDEVGTLNNEVAIIAWPSVSGYRQQNMMFVEGH